MQDYFATFADTLTQQLHANEIYLAWFAAEHSDFTRFNHAKIRQIGSVTQLYLKLNLIQGQRHALGELALSGDLSEDMQRSQALLDFAFPPAPFARRPLLIIRHQHLFHF